MTFAIDDRPRSYNLDQCFAVSDAGDRSILVGDELHNRLAPFTYGVDADGEERIEVVGEGYAYDADNPAPTETVFGPSYVDQERLSASNEAKDEENGE